jgi:Alkylmercury lyase
MQAFRSEAHVDRWCAQSGIARGAAFPLETAWRLADAWFRDRLSVDWRRRSAGEAEELFAALGLTGPFWKLA